MKSLRNDAAQSQSTYPCLMQTENGKVVLFSGAGVGIVVHKGDQTLDKIGHFSQNWVMTYFTPYLGSITLSNS